MIYKETNKIKELLASAEHIVVIQADNPDGDSLGSALALEAILIEQGKKVSLYCGVDMPGYLRYVPGWDRVSQDLPQRFDLSIIVDNSSLSLLENLQKSNQAGWLATRPCIVIDHHDIESSIPFASVICNYPAVATAEVIYELGLQLSWTVPLDAAKALTVAILSDSLGLMSDATSARSLEIVTELVKNGVSLAGIDTARRELMKKSAELTRYKGKLLQRIEYELDGRVALVTISWEEIQRYSHAWNPSMLVLDEMRMVTDVQLAIAFKSYPDGKVTAKIRTNLGTPIANKLAEEFGGGGHAYAAGFKSKGGQTLDDIKQRVIKTTEELLNTTTT